MRRYIFLFLSITFSFSLETVAIIDFEGIGISESEARALTQRLTSEIVEIGKFTVVERSEMKRLLNEQKFQYSGCVDVSCAVEIGKLLGAKSMVVGTISKLGNSYSVDSRLIDVKTAENYVSANYTTTKDLSDVLNGMRTIAYKICEMEVPENLIIKDNLKMSNVNIENSEKYRDYGISIGLGGWHTAGSDGGDNFGHPLIISLFYNFNKPLKNLQFEIYSVLNDNYKATNINYLINKNYYIQRFTFNIGFGYGDYEFKTEGLDTATAVSFEDMLFPKFGEEIETKNKIMIQLGIGTELFSISALDLYIVGKIGTSLDKGVDNINFAGCMLTFEF